MCMVKRLKIGLIYSYNIDWVAGAYYILNLVQAINKLDDQHKPELIILSHTTDEFNTIRETGYPYLTFLQLNRTAMIPSYSLFERGINKLFRKVSGKELIKKTHTKNRLPAALDVLFPATTHIYFSNIKNRLFWIPDFQEYFLPQFFSEEEIRSRSAHQQQLTKKGTAIVFSSNDACAHFHTFHPQSQAKTFVLQFAVTHPAYEHISMEALRSKFSINRPYFFCPNQVWRHKNHLTVLKAVKRLKDKGESEMLVVFSGKEYDNRNPHVFEELKNYIQENGIEEQVKFLGFIDRKEQLQLMKNALCVLQPSLFEGWSTSVEDAKAMGQYLIVSDLPVHREQVKGNAVFFNATDEAQLADCLSKMQHHELIKTGSHNYQEDILKFGEQFIKIANEVQDTMKR
jgi:glycosyltransferase involved in cell wall biosynthesis